MQKPSYSQTYDTIRKALEHLHHTHHDNLSDFAQRPPQNLEQLANSLGYSPTYFQKLFTQYAGISPKKFQQALTRQHAVEMLTHGFDSLNTAMACGLASTSQLHQLAVTFEALTPAEIRHGGKQLSFKTGEIESPFGPMWICLTPKGIHRMDFALHNINFESWQAQIKARFPMANITALSQAESIFWSSQIFPHSQPTTDEPSMNKHHYPQPVSPLRLHVQASLFQLKVWEALVRLPAGRLISYKQLAHAVGQPQASRAVGSAVASNTVAYLIPCHRVIQSTGVLGNYRWNAARKEIMHAWEFSRLSGVDHSIVFESDHR